MTAIYGETVKNGIIAELSKSFPDIAIYKEQITNALYPHFFVYQVTMSSVEDRRDHWFLNYLINIRYRHVADVATEPRLEQRLDSMILDLGSELTSIDVGDNKIKLTNIRCEKVDGVIQYFANVKLQVAKEIIRTDKPMKNLIIDINMK